MVSLLSHKIDLTFINPYRRLQEATLFEKMANGGMPQKIDTIVVFGIIGAIL